MSNLQIQLATRWLRGAGVIAYPTEAVWGLGCDPWSEPAVRRVLAIKQRPVEKGLILVASGLRQLAPLFDPLTAQQKLLLEDSWPGPVTWLLPDPENLIPDWIKGDFDTVAIRVSAHPTVVALCNAFGGMIVSTSANLAGKPEIRSRLRLEAQLGDKIDFVVPGQLGGAAQPSAIRDLRSGRVHR